MPSIVVKERQTLFDIAAIFCGSAAAAFDLALLNGLSITDKLYAGTSLELPTVVDEQVTTELLARKAIAATEDEERYQSERGIGLSFIIGTTFEVQ